MTLIVILIVAVILLTAALIIAIPQTKSRKKANPALPQEPESDRSIDEVYQLYLAAMHNETLRYLRDEAPADREWIDDIKAQARVNIGLVSWFEVDFGRLTHIRELNPTYVGMSSEFVANARAS